MRLTISAAVILTFLCHSTLGIFEEQAGQYDWHRSQIGKVILAKFAFRGRSRAFVATDAGVLAALDLKDGAIIWRQVLEEDELITHLVLLPKPAAVATLSGRGRYLRIWNAADGVLLWQQHSAVTPNSGSPVAIEVLPDGLQDRPPLVAVLANNKLQVYTAATGKPVFASDSLAEGQTLAARLAPAATSVGTFVHAALLEAGGSSAIDVTYKWGHSDKLQHVSTQTVKLPAPVHTFAGLGHSSALAFVSSDGSSLCLVGWPGEAPKVECVPLEADLRGSGQATASVVTLEGIDVVAVVGPGGVGLYGTKTGGRSLVRLAFVAGGSSTSQPLVTDADNLVAVSVPGQVSGDGLHAALDVHIVSLKSGTTVSQLSVEGLKLVTDSGTAAGVPLIALGRTSDAADYRLLLGAEEGTLALFERGGIAWLREEALAAIQGAVFVDLPAPSPELEAQIRASAPTLAERFQAEFLALKETLGFGDPKDAAKVAALKAKGNDRLWPSRDAEGFRKLLVVLSKHGKLLGLHSGDGRVLWGLPLDPTCPPAALKLWRSSHDAVHAPEVVVLGNGPSGACFTVVDAHSGKALTGGAIPVPFSQVLEAPGTLSEGATEQRVLLLLGAQGAALQLHVLPDTSAALALVQAAPAALHLWQANSSTGVVSGFQIAAPDRVETTWSASLSSHDDVILTAATRAPGEPVYSHAKVLGDRSLKLKYLNPNLLLLASGPPDGVPGASLKAPRLTISLLDTVTGQVLFRQTHQDARGPVHAALCEHWAVYHFWSVANHRHEMAVLELYDATPRDISVSDVLFGAENNTQSAFLPPPLDVLTQTFAVREGVRALAPVATQRGITAKLLLLATLSDQVYMMDKRFLDPRRPKGTPSKEDQAEMLMPFDPELPINPLMFASHRHTIARVSGIITNPAALESTALVLAHGLDVFVTRVQPSRTFDIIPDDFPYALLITITLVLAIAALTLRKLESSSSISKKWT